MSKQEDIKALERFMDNLYQSSEPDLPRAGDWHFATAVDFLADRAHDECWTKFYGRIPKHLDLKVIATRVVRRYAGNDSAWSRRKEKALQRQWERKGKELHRKRKEPQEKKWDDRRPINKGIGSY